MKIRRALRVKDLKEKFDPKKATYEEMRKRNEELKVIAKMYPETESGKAARVEAEAWAQKDSEGKLRIEAIKSLAKQNKKAEAIARAKELIEKFPNTPYAEKAKAMIALLTKDD